MKINVKLNKSRFSMFIDIKEHHNIVVADENIIKDIMENIMTPFASVESDANIFIKMPDGKLRQICDGKDISICLHRGYTLLDEVVETTSNMYNIYFSPNDFYNIGTVAYGKFGLLSVSMQGNIYNIKTLDLKEELVNKQPCRVESLYENIARFNRDFNMYFNKSSNCFLHSLYMLSQYGLKAKSRYSEFLIKAYYTLVMSGVDIKRDGIFKNTYYDLYEVIRNNSMEYEEAEGLLRASLMDAYKLQSLRNLRFDGNDLIFSHNTMTLRLKNSKGTFGYFEAVYMINGDSGCFIIEFTSYTGKSNFLFVNPNKRRFFGAIVENATINGIEAKNYATKVKPSGILCKIKPDESFVYENEEVSHLTIELQPDTRYYYINDTEKQSSLSILVSELLADNNNILSNTNIKIRGYNGGIVRTYGDESDITLNICLNYKKVRQCHENEYFIYLDMMGTFNNVVSPSDMLDFGMLEQQSGGLITVADLTKLYDMCIGLDKAYLYENLGRYRKYFRKVFGSATYSEISKIIALLQLNNFNYDLFKNDSDMRIIYYILTKVARFNNRPCLISYESDALLDSAIRSGETYKDVSNLIDAYFGNTSDLKTKKYKTVQGFHEIKLSKDVILLVRSLSIHSKGDSEEVDIQKVNGSNCTYVIRFKYGNNRSMMIVDNEKKLVFTNRHYRFK